MGSEVTHETDIERQRTERVKTSSAELGIFIVGDFVEIFPVQYWSVFDFL